MRRICGPCFKVRHPEGPPFLDRGESLAQSDAERDLARSISN